MIRYTLFHNQDAMFMRVGTPEDTYIMGYSGKLYTVEGKIPNILEHIFERHNLDERPDAKSKPSLSVGDAVVLMMDDHIGEPYVYSVAVFGFNEWRTHEHEPDWTTVTHADLPPDEPIMDVWCGECGQSGSFRLSESDIEWV